MSPQTRRYLHLVGGFLVGTVAVTLGFFVICRYMNEPLDHTSEAPTPVGGIECRIVWNNQLNRLVSAFKQLPPGRLRTHGLPPTNNPFLMNDLLARVEVRNVAGRELAVFQWTHTPGCRVTAWSYGVVTTAIEDEAGNPVRFYDPTTRSLLEIDDPDNVGSPRQIITLPPGQVLTYPFSILGNLDATFPIRPGTYTVRAVFLYYEAPGGDEHRVLSNPVKVQFTQQNLDEWHALFDLWVRF